MSNPKSSDPSTCFFVYFRYCDDDFVFHDEYKYFATKDEGNAWFTAWANDELPGVMPLRYGEAVRTEDGEYKRLTSNKFVPPADDDEDEED